MRIGIDVRISRGWATGVGQYTINLLNHLAQIDQRNEYLVLTNPAAPQVPVAAPERFTFLPTPIPIASAKQIFVLPVLASRLGLDLHFNTHPLAAPLWLPCKTVSLLLDVYPINFPDDYPKTVNLYYRTVVRAAMRTRQAILAISNHTRRQAARALWLAEDKITVVPLAAGRQFTATAGINDDEVIRRYHLRRPYVLYHGNKRPHKNLPRLIAAFALVNQSCPAVSLAITGPDNPAEPADNLASVRVAVAEHRLQDSVIYTGLVADDDLPAVYRGAAILTMPSLDEGFGLPALEAMACGTPVVAANRGALPEVLGEAGLLVDPLNVPALAEAIGRVLSSSALRQQLSSRALKQASLFSWERTARETLALFESVCGGR